MARFVEDLTLTLPLLCGSDWYDASVVPVPLGDPATVNLSDLRVAVHTDNGLAPAAADVAGVVNEAAAALRSVGVTVNEDRPQALTQTLDLFLGHVMADGGAGLQRVVDMTNTREISSHMKTLRGLQVERQLTTAEFFGLAYNTDQYRNKMLAFMRQYDMILCPANAQVAVPHDATLDPDLWPAFTYTMSYNLTGWPGVVVRCGTSSEGLPVGVQIVARPWCEHVALAAALFLEKEMGGWQRPLI